jgi:hypothetical protein
MTGLYERGVACEGGQRGGLIPPEERRDLVLWRLQSGALQPRQRVFAVAPAPLDRVQLGAIRWPAHETHVGRQRQLLARMRPTVVQEQKIQAVRAGLCEGVHNELEALGMQLRPFPEEPIARRRLYGAIARAPRRGRLNGPDGRHPTRRQTAAADRESAEAPVVWAEHSEGTGVRGGEHPRELCTTGGRKGRHGLRVFWCDGAAAP